MEEKRKRTIYLLSNVLKVSQNIKTIEELIYIYSSMKTKYNYTQEDIYDMILYQCLTHLKNGMSIKEIGNFFTTDQFLFRHIIFEKILQNQLEHDNYIENPVDITEGVFECSKCKSSHIITFQKQTRKADEGYTIFNTCVKCNHKWKIN